MWLYSQMQVLTTKLNKMQENLPNIRISFYLVLKSNWNFKVLPPALNVHSGKVSQSTVTKGKWAMFAFLLKIFIFNKANKNKYEIQQFTDSDGVFTERADF